jgi:hypothetical protein
MMASRGMGAIAPSKMPKGVRKARRDNTDFTEYAEGGMLAPPMTPQFKHVRLPKKELASALDRAKNSGDKKLEQELISEQAIRKSLSDNYSSGGKVGLYDNINAKRKRIASGSGEKMRKVGSKGAPTKSAFLQSAKTAKK